MASTAPRPVGVTVVAVLMIISGSNVVRLIVSILQVLSLASSVYTLVSGGSIGQALQTIIFPLLILILLWVGEKTKAFFAS